MITKLLLLCGGPSEERNISLNSARSVYDHLENEFNIEIIFIDQNMKKFSINGGFLYSNTTNDFDFKLRNEGIDLSEDEFLEKIKSNDFIFTIIHGIFGEDGQFQHILESQIVSFVGSSSNSCNQTYNKKNLDKFITENGYFNIPKLFIDFSSDQSIEEKISKFFDDNKLSECIIKPIKGGSSFGIFHARNINEAINYLPRAKKYADIVLEPRCHGKEFTVIVLQNKNKPVALLPTEIEVKDSKNIIFDTRRKYLSTNETHYYCPPRFSKETIDLIRYNAEKLLNLAHASDFLRIDGWLLDNGSIYFSDFNPISGMEQNSFIFQQASKVGLTHKEILNYIIDSCGYRNNLKISRRKIEKNKNVKKVNVIFGGSTSERQVSLLSGSNVWLKLSKSSELDVKPYLLFKEDLNLDDDPENFRVAYLPYNMVLNHTVEEILYQCGNNTQDFDNYINDIRESLGLVSTNFDHPKYFSLIEFLEKCKSENAYLFLALHGGFGENGGIQSILERIAIEFNGSRADVSKFCMNKFRTSELINSLNIKKVRSAKHKLLNLLEPFDLKNLWNEIKVDLGNKVIVKPNCDGSSSGVVVLENYKDLENYINFTNENRTCINKNTFKHQNNIINMGKNVKELLFEEFIETDRISVLNGKIIRQVKNGWLEFTVGVLEQNGIYHSLNPSITVSESDAVLTVEEKFQGGTGINITPPPSDILDAQLLNFVKENMELISEKIGIKDYCRIDIFVNTISSEIIVIEFNTLPALTPSTVIFQQAVKEINSLSPLDFVLKIIQ